ncbi:hypothetical protein ACCO45_010084 [Purpureocillium lilacinum]|uniref:Uncharacterized protein n=1 Tax=Purpureocillium lilacinum TaxID=33203 RepID=A0ACC4DGE5_PURLI
MFNLLSLSAVFLAIIQVPVSESKSLWSSHPAIYRTGNDSVLKTGYPVGNGKLGGVQFGSPGADKVVMNIDSLWIGGPFENSLHGGNPLTDKSAFLPGIREFIFKNGTGDVSPLFGNIENFGSNRVMGNFSVEIDHGNRYDSYRRELDLDTGLHTTSYRVKGVTFKTTLFCSNPANVCVYHISSSRDLPGIQLQFENQAVPELGTAMCGRGFTRYRGITQIGPPEGMKYEAMARVIGSIKTQSTAADSSFTRLLQHHISDFRSLSGAFELVLPDPHKSEKAETATAISRYAAMGSAGDPFIESLLFDLSRYLLISSSRPNSLPANLQGRWVDKMNAEWGADYHANINLQMSYWVADQTGLGSTLTAVWNFMRDTWIPRGRETAKLLYNAPGWTSHHATNIFGHTGMKNTARWSNYPAAPAWMMQHVWDYFEYTQDTTWLRSTGYPFLKEVAQFWLSQLQNDGYNGDGSLVVNPCNSPEHGPTTFACTHFQQLIHQVFEALLNAVDHTKNPSCGMGAEVSKALPKLDKGLHFTSWGGVKEWKLRDAEGYDDKNTHRHLSHLQGGQERTTKNTGWGKAWRAACWARLNDTAMAHSELRLLVAENFASNGLDMYSGHTPPFQIDANFGFGGAILSMLVVDLPLSYKDRSQVRTVVLGPAIPRSWAGGSVKSLRLRGGGLVDFTWDSRGKVTKSRLRGNIKPLKLVNVDGRPLN